MAPKRSSEEEERRARKRAEEDLVSLTSETARCRGMERRWQQEKERWARMLPEPGSNW